MRRTDTPPLGIYAGIDSPPRKTPSAIDPTTGEVLDPPRDFRAVRAERFALKAFASRLLPKGSRTSKCMRWRVPKRELEVIYSNEHHKAHYHGLQVCGSPWTCPVCASKISERRKVEVAGAIATANAMGLQVWLLTLTAPHTREDELRPLVDRQLAAYRRLFQGKTGLALKASLGLEGTIRALEVTFGPNGGHPHLHVLLFVAPGKGFTPAHAQALIAPRWQKVAVACGLEPPSLSHGCRVDGGDKAAAYVAKGSSWGLESEVTKGQVKIAKGPKGRTPFALLKDYGDGDKQAGALFAEYAQAFEGRRQLVWSKGLKRRLAVVDLTDEELVTQLDDTPTRRLATITDPQWITIRKRRLESVVLDLAEISQDALLAFLRALDSPPCS